jgi:outer membrane protein TolC
MGIYVNYLLFDGMSRSALRDQLQLQSDISNLQTRNAIEQTILSLSSAWYTTIQLQRSATVLQQSIDVSNERYRIATYKESIGAGSKLDMMQALVDLRSDSAQRAQIDMQIAQQMGIINTLLARKPETSFSIADTLVLRNNLQYADIVSAAEENTTVIAANAQKAFMESLVRTSRAALLPSLGLTAGYGYFRSTSEAGFVSSNMNLGPSAGLTLQIPIFNGGVYKTNVQIAEQQADIAQDALNKQLMDVYQQTYAAWQSYTTAQTLTQLAIANEQTAIENTNIALEKFSSGAISSIDLRAIQQSRIDAGNQVAIYMLNTKLAELELLYVSGQLFVEGE